MKHLFLPYELAVIAKEKGFNEPCLAVFFYHKNFKMCPDLWDNDNPCHNTITNTQYYKEDNYGDLVTAPLYQQVLNWLRISHSIKIVLDAESDCECYYLYSNRQVVSKHGYIEKAIEKALTLVK